MKEFGFTIEPLGLATDEDSLEGCQYLRNLVPDKGCWRVPRIPTIPTGWSTGQLFRLKSFTLFCKSTQISEVNETTLAQTYVATVPAGDAWSVADFGPVWVAANGTRVVSRFPDGTSFDIINQTSPRFGVVACHLDTRFIYGDCDLGKNWVGWSDMMGESLPYLLSGTTVPDRILQRNDTNSRPMPWRGRVLSILPMGDMLIVYGEDGVSALKVDGINYALLDLKGLPRDIGVLGRQSACGAEDLHVFVGRDGAIYQVTPDLTVNRIKSVVAPSSTATVAYNALEDEFWISGGATSLVLTKEGLGGPIDAVVRSVVQIGNTQYAVGTGYPDPLPAELWTSLFDAGDVSLKRLTFVRVGGDGLSDLKVATKTRFATWSQLSRFPWNRCSPEGAGFVNCAMASGQVGVNAMVAPGSRIWRIEVRVQAGDKRYIRGTRGVPKEEE